MEEVGLVLLFGNTQDLGVQGTEESRLQVLQNCILADSGICHLSSPEPFVREVTRSAWGLLAGKRRGQLQT